MIAFDTNVLLYAADRRHLRKQRIAIETLEAAPDAILLWQVACEFIAAARKLSNHGLSVAEAWDILEHYRRTFRLVLPTPPVLERARLLHTEQGWSFWDAVLVGACLEEGITTLYSEDQPGRPAPQPLQIVNPFVR